MSETNIEKYMDAKFETVHTKLDSFISKYEEAHAAVVDDVKCNKTEIEKHNGYINRIVGGGIIVTGLLSLWAKFSGGGS